MSAELRDRRGRPVVVVTGMGLVTPLGWGAAANWSRLIAGESGINSITRFPTMGLKTTIAGTIQSQTGAPYSAFALALEIAEAAADEAVRQSGIGVTGRFPGPLFIATPPSELEWPQLARLVAADGGVADPGDDGGYQRLLAAARSRRFDDLRPHAAFASIADAVQTRFGTIGEPLSICTACASGASTIQMAMETLRRGEAEAALCIGTDATVHPEGLVRFSLLSALTTRNDPPEKASRPFAKSRDGFVIAEGAGAVVVETLEHARARGAKPLGVVLGAGEKADCYHRTRSKPDGSAIIGAMQKALADADISAGAIDHVNAHGTSTPENDKMEDLALRHVLGERVRDVPVTSNKSQVGHTLIAAGAVEAVISLLTMREGVIPPTINHDDPDPDLALDVVANTARRASVRTILSNSFGFGGQNVCLVLAAEPS
ncbi:MAG: beta-ketoacyl-ACP synthase [Hyphomicrobiaceae bacterium]|nr:beta-ketoacyl-ACP synthase [Hyphomicrobiaceae bacterium]MCC0008212.1 beta-ketoacyl-ACP synthase [Hyphomicrobiaceae bacterium]